MCSRWVRHQREQVGKGGAGEERFGGEENYFPVPKTDYPLLKPIQLFKSLTAGQNASMCQQMRLQMFKKGESVCAKGQEGHEMFIISSGALDIQITNNEGKPVQTLTILRGMR